MKKRLVTLVLVLLTLAAMVGTASARARGIIVWDEVKPGLRYGNYK